MFKSLGHTPKIQRYMSIDSSKLGKGLFYFIMHSLLENQWDINYSPTSVLKIKARREHVFPSTTGTIPEIQYLLVACLS